jgi:hypothetical protein
MAVFQQVAGVLYRRGDHVLARGPFSEIDQPATFAAEREVLRTDHDGLLANGTLQLNVAFPCHFSIVDGNEAEASA